MGFRNHKIHQIHQKRTACGGIKPRSGYATVLGSGFGERYAQDCMCGFSTSRTILLAAAHGHISVLRQRAPTNSKRDSQNSSFIIHQFIIGSRYPINKRAREGCFYAMSEISSSQKVLYRFIFGRYVLNVCYPIRNDRIGNSPVEILIKN